MLTIAGYLWARRIAPPAPVPERTQGSLGQKRHQAATFEAAVSKSLIWGVSDAEVMPSINQAVQVMNSDGTLVHIARHLHKGKYTYMWFITEEDKAGSTPTNWKGNDPVLVKMGDDECYLSKSYIAFSVFSSATDWTRRLPSFSVITTDADGPHTNLASFVGLPK